MGCAKDPKIVFIEGNSVEITKNLFLALRDLRDEGRDLRLWVDALCINQQDEAEKNVQVKMMGQIYATADQTIIYILSQDDERKDKTLAVSTQNTYDLAVPVEDIWESQWPKRVWTFQELVFPKRP